VHPPIGRAAQAANAAANEPGEQKEPTPEVTIGGDGHFLGGDETATTLVIEMLDVPATKRSVRVKATPLQDESYRLNNPHNYVLLRDRVHAYELSLGRLLRGRVTYCWKWQVEDLVEAVLELRCIELPAQHDRQWWYTWDPKEPNRAITVGFDAKSVESMQTHYYGPMTNRVPDTDMGLPADEPVWLVSLSPSIVWQRVVPAAVADQRRRYLDPPDPPVLDISQWLVSDRKPGELSRTRPIEEKKEDRPPAWNW
jgi:hypothetical protein